MKMKVATLYCFVGGIYSSIQTGVLDDSEASFFPNIKDSNFHIQKFKDAHPIKKF